MSNQAMTWAYRQPVQPTTAKFVFVTLANYANPDGYCYASQERIATDTGQGVRTVRRQLAELQDAGWIVRERRMAKRGGRAPDGYYLVGFADELPAKVTANQPANLASNPAANMAGNHEGVTGQIRTGYRPNQDTHTIGVEPTIEPTILVPPTSELVGPPQKSRARRPVFDALVEAWRPGTPTTALTRSEQKEVGRCTGELEGVGATADDVAQRSQRYRAEWPKAEFTPAALVKHWNRFADRSPPPANGWIPKPWVPYGERTTDTAARGSNS